ncbi:MAG TPA: TraM recognition domain-containing protein, partial [Verrucomicrobiae bacterium]|nr:TraM recognition domain-containing protein [Verrucomicrobiae bacterium]
SVTDEDKRLLDRASSYWRKIYPELAAKTRSSVTLGVYSMLDAFRGRDIPALISSDTNITPERVISEGKIVVLDFPINDMGHTGLILQSAWRFLFQTALQRFSQSSAPSRRPLFLWEDEAQHFVTDFDHQFQATARSSRLSHVVLTQNAPGFNKELRSTDATNSIFGNLNTKIFHANADLTSAQWASSCIGQVIRHRVSISHSPPQPKPQRSLADSITGMFDARPSTASVTAGEQWEPVVRPEEFAQLRTGGPENDFQVDAFITWIGASGPEERHFTHITFNQNPEL